MLWEAGRGVSQPLAAGSGGGLHGAALPTYLMRYGHGLGGRGGQRPRPLVQGRDEGGAAAAIGAGGGGGREGAWMYPYVYMCVRARDRSDGCLFECQENPPPPPPPPPSPHTHIPPPPHIHTIPKKKSPLSLYYSSPPLPLCPAPTDGAAAPLPHRRRRCCCCCCCCCWRAWCAAPPFRGTAP